jgi:hypothetical protein
MNEERQGVVLSPSRNAGSWLRASVGSLKATSFGPALIGICNWHDVSYMLKVYIIET